MGTWSIEPQTLLAVINEQGILAYSEHTEDKQYTIKYQDDTCGTITKDITIKKCEGPTPPCPKDWGKIDTLTITNHSTLPHTFSDIKFSANMVEYTITFSVNVPGEGTESTTDATIAPSIPEGTTSLLPRSGTLRVDGVVKSDAIFSLVKLTDCALTMEVTFT